MLEIYVDGASAGNPGPSGIGFLIKNKQIYLENYVYIGQSTNHEAEFKALIYALNFCLDHFPNEILSIRSDSKLLVDAIEKGYVKKEPFQTLLREVQVKMDFFPYCFIKWISDQQNKQADRLARQAIQTKDTKLNECPSE
ncbi:ribonuclease HI family protein [Amphibacillus sp. MSJ-3]|uniref:ribonuclease HI family protein n=1 Tax=Amphibacillus sp. MSJ-3 TaxID=2841505 RepID=UPI001C0F079B|nr:ribonuclease HI family protein [Amphibacillus sp. MSJ-3]MBU5594198.1 ribonuclease HI family protein [Amphibacillus sp. MSJ-3]